MRRIAGAVGLLVAAWVGALLGGALYDRRYRRELTPAPLPGTAPSWQRQAWEYARDLPESRW